MTRADAPPPAATRPDRPTTPRRGPDRPLPGGLVRSREDLPGIRRVRSGRGSRLVDPAGRPVRDEETSARIRALAIPPAWTEVWICPDEAGHIQATGRDARGRKQYRYHARWRSARDESKYRRVLEFAAALPRLRARIDRDLARPGLPRSKVLAAVVALLETTLIRVGNAEYAKANQSFGLTTMQDRHVAVAGAGLTFRFRGKSGVRHEIGLEDRRLATIVRRCRDLPGQELFQYLDARGRARDVGSADVNDYLRRATGREFTAKDFRTWAGTVLATLALQEVGSFSTKVEARRNVVRAIESVATRLGNTPSVCRKCYVHPEVIETYLEGSLADALRRRADRELATELAHLRPEEAAVLALLRERLGREATKRRRGRRGD